jgi:hypothetical protein
MAKQLSLDVHPIDLREPLLTAAQAAKLFSRSAPPGSLTPPAAATSRACGSASTSASCAPTSSAGWASTEADLLPVAPANAHRSWQLSAYAN